MRHVVSCVVVLLLAGCGDDAGPGVDPAAGSRPVPDTWGEADEIAVAWLVSGSADYSVLVRRFVASEAGLEALDVESIETGTPPYTSGIDLDLRDDGRWLLAWNSFGDAEGKADLHARLFDRDGRPLSPRFEPTAARAGHQKVQQARGTRRVLYRPGLGLAFAWTGDAGRGDDTAANLTLLRESATDAAGERGCSPALRDEGEAGGNLVVLADKQAPVPHDPPTFNPRDIAPPEPPRVSPEGLGFGFDGVLSTGWTPPDPHMAVGPTHIVLMTNGAIAFFAKDGTKTFQDEIEDSFGFWGTVGATGFMFDPEVIFDPHSGRFMAMACERSSDSRSFFLLAVSDDSDPNGTWHRYRFDVTALADRSIDSPNVAVDANAVYLASDHFSAVTYLVFIVQNSQEVEVDFIVATTSTPLFFVLIITFALGALFGWLWPHVRRDRRRQREDDRR